MKQIYTFLALLAATSFITPALAQTSTKSANILKPYVGASAGYHTVDDGDVGIDADGLIYGGFVGINFAHYRWFYFGVEGNFHLGSNAIDYEYGGTAHIGYLFTPNFRAFVRGGYQEIDFDTVSLTEDAIGRDLTQTEIDAINDADLEDAEGGALVGLGVEFDVMQHGSVRLGVDTIEFDSARGYAGFLFRF
ncbi:MAG: outer membrane beta-barrel protein [Pseudomonadota bacterium]